MKQKILCFLSDNVKKDLDIFDKSNLTKEKQLMKWVNEHNLILDKSCEPWLILKQQEIDSRVLSQTVFKVKIGR